MPLPWCTGERVPRPYRRPKGGTFLCDQEAVVITYPEPLGMGSCYKPYYKQHCEVARHAKKLSTERYYYFYVFLNFNTELDPLANAHWQGLNRSLFQVLIQQQ